MASDWEVTPTFALALKLWETPTGIARALNSDALPVQRQKVEYWLERLGFIPEEFALTVQDESEGKILAEDILREARIVREAMAAEKGAAGA